MVMEAVKVTDVPEVPLEHALVTEEAASLTPAATKPAEEEDYTMVDKPSMTKTLTEAATGEAAVEEPAAVGGTTSLLGPVLDDEEADESTAGITMALGAPEEAVDEVAAPETAPVALETVKEAAIPAKAPATKEVVVPAVEPVEAVEASAAVPVAAEADEVAKDVSIPAVAAKDDTVDSTKVTVNAAVDAEPTEALATDPNVLDAPVAPPPVPVKTPSEEFAERYAEAKQVVAEKDSRVKEIEGQLAGLSGIPLAAAKRELRHATVEHDIAEKHLSILKEEDERITKMKQEAEERDATLSSNSSNIKELLVQLEKTQVTTADSAQAARKAQLEAQKKAEEEEAFLAELGEDKVTVLQQQASTETLKTAIENLKAKDIELSKMKLEDLAYYKTVLDAEEHVILYTDLLKEARADREKMHADVSDEESIQTIAKVITYEEKLEHTQTKLKVAKEAAAKLKPEFEKVQAEFLDLQATLLEELHKCHADASGREAVKAKVAPAPAPPPPAPVVQETPKPDVVVVKAVEESKAPVEVKTVPVSKPTPTPAARAPSAPSDASSKSQAASKVKSNEFVRTKASLGVTLKKLLKIN